MILRNGGVDLFYVDESEKHPIYVVTAVRVPFLRLVGDQWTFVWQDYLDAAIKWRRELSKAHNIKYRKELHGSELLKHQGLYKKPNDNLRPDEAVALYKEAVGKIDFLPPASIITAFATEPGALMGERRTKAAMLALFQRIRRQCGTDVNGLLIFDDGHPEYVPFYRRATKWLPTGSKLGGWDGKGSANFALDMFPKDANVKASNLSLFLQIADLIVVAARLKLESEKGLLPAKRVTRGHHTLYDAVLKSRVNLAATGKRADGLVPAV